MLYLKIEEYFCIIWMKLSLPWVIIFTIPWIFCGSIFDGLDAKFTIGDVWLTLATEAPAAAPTWPDCKVLYYHEADMMPQIWIREDGLGNRYFYSMQFHDTEDGVHSDFWHNLLMRAIEYIGGEREVQPTPLPTITPTPGTGLKGDVDDDAEVTIVDALLIAQKYVGIPLGIFLTENADVNCDNEIDIIDALLVAQLYVGLIASFPC